MKAIVCTKYGPPEVLQLTDLHKPVPKDREVLVRVLATAVTSSDCYVRGMDLSPLYRFAGRMALGFKKPRQPVLGMVFAGEVESLGRQAARFSVGDRVFGIDRFRFGAYAQFKSMPEDGMIALSPANLTDEATASLPYGGALALAFLRGRIPSGQRVLIYGASGAVGTAAVQLAKYYGARVTGVCGSSNLALVKTLGADDVLDYAKEDIAQSGAVYDLVFDAVGRKKREGFGYRKVLAPGGKFISVDGGRPRLLPEDLTLLTQLAQEGKIKPVIDRCWPLEKMAEAHRYVDLGHKKGNVIILVAHEGEPAGGCQVG
ncbi:MAG: NAD(P)-dependent alcohol dehydrogenase [Christensenellales bacterium]